MWPLCYCASNKQRRIATNPGRTLRWNYDLRRQLDLLWPDLVCMLFLVDLWVTIKLELRKCFFHLRWIVGMVLLIHFVKKNGWTFRRVVAHPRKPHHFLAIEPPGDDVIFFNSPEASRRHMHFSRWWFQRVFMFIPTWGKDPIWLIFFKWVETTNQIIIWTLSIYSTLNLLHLLLLWDIKIIARLWRRVLHIYPSFPKALGRVVHNYSFMPSITPM